MSEIFHFLTIPYLLAMFLAVNMGGSGTSPAFAAAYGANVIRREFIPGLFGVMVLAGALIAGEEVSLTLGKGLLDESYFTPTITAIVLLSIALSLLFANLIGVPQSTSQSTVLAISGAGLALDNLGTRKLFYEIIPTWFILPVIAFAIMLVLAKWVFPLLRKTIFTVDYARLQEHAGLRTCLILASLYVAFSIGSNNVANAAAPIASLTVNELGAENIGNFLPIIVLSVLIVAPCFAIGSSLLGYKTTKSTGKDIVEVSPFYATVIAVLVATLLLLASLTRGIPTSLVQLNAGAFIALGISKNGIKHTFKNMTVRRFFTVWMIAPLFSFILSYLLVVYVK